MYYHTFKQLRNAVERKYGKQLPDHIWNELEPDYESAWDEYDIDAILDHIPDYIPQKKTIRKNKTLISLRMLGIYVPIHHLAERMRPRLKEMRKLLGLDNPIPIEQIKDILIKFGASEKKSVIKIPYPLENLYEFDGFNLLVIDHIKIPNTESSILSLIPSLITLISESLHCHNATALAFFFCDIVPKYRPSPTVVMDIDGEFFTIFVSQATDSPESVKRAYSYARNIAISWKRKIHGDWARPRSITSKILDLIIFIKENPDINWQTRFYKWNNEHPDLAYRSLHSMQVSYYRALKLYKERRHTDFRG